MANNKPKFELETYLDNDKVVEVHLTEFQALRSEIEMALNAQNTLSNYAIGITAGTATLFAVGQPPIALQTPFLLLIVSILLSSVNLAIIDQGYSIQDMANYIQNILTPKIQDFIANVNDDVPESPRYVVLKWEDERSKFTGRLAIRGMTSLGKYAIGYIPSILLIMMFVSFRRQINSTSFWYENVLFFTALTLVVVVPFIGAFNALYVVRKRNDP